MCVECSFKCFNHALRGTFYKPPSVIPMVAGWIRVMWCDALWHSRIGLDGGGFHAGSAVWVPAAERVSGQYALGTAPVEWAVGCRDPHHALRRAHKHHTLWGGKTLMSLDARQQVFNIIEKGIAFDPFKLMQNFIFSLIWEWDLKTKKQQQLYQN